MTEMSKRWRSLLALVTLIAAVGLAGTVTPSAGAEGATWQDLQEHGWTCFPSPINPAITVCFNPGEGRPFPGNPDPRPTYNARDFDTASGEFLYTVHLVRDDVYNGQPCGQDPYIFRALIGYWECPHD
jgi:hypothetical protein